MRQKWAFPSKIFITVNECAFLWSINIVRLPINIKIMDPLGILQLLRHYPDFVFYGENTAFLTASSVSCRNVSILIFLIFPCYYFIHSRYLLWVSLLTLFSGWARDNLSNHWVVAFLRHVQRLFSFFVRQHKLQDGKRDASPVLIPKFAQKLCQDSSLRAPVGPNCLLSSWKSPEITQYLLILGVSEMSSYL